MKKFTSILLSLLLVLAAPLSIFAGTDLPDTNGAFAPVADAAIATPGYGDVKIETDWVIDAKGCIAVKVYFVDAIDLMSWDMKLTYDADIFDFADKAGGADAQQVQNYCISDYNTFVDHYNDFTDGEIRVSGYFKEVLWSAEDFLAASLPGKECIVNDEKFEAVVFYLKVEDKAAFDAHATTISIEGSMTFRSVGDSFHEVHSVGDSITKSATILYGDVDGDGYLSAEDARRTLRAAVGLEALTEVQEYAADTNRDGRIAADDSRLTLRAVVGLEYIDNIAPHIPILAPSDDPSAPWVTIETDWVMNYDQTIAVKVYFENAIGLNSWDLLLTYDADIFDFDEKALGADAKQVKYYCISDYNTFDDFYNDFTDGENRVSGYFKENLWTAEEFLANSNRDGDCIVNDEKFEAAVFYLEVEDPVAFNSEEITIRVKGNLRTGDTIVGTADIIEKTGCPHRETHTTTTPASCISTGITETICLDCGEITYTESLPVDPDNHVNLRENPTFPATCISTGTKSSDCTACGVTIYEPLPIDPDNHVNLRERPIAPATCISTGTKSSDCTACGVTITEILPVDPHNHTGETEIRNISIQPTDRLPGVGELWCLDCGQMINATEPIPPLDCIGYGMCGDNLHWVLKTDGTMYIFGTGEMYNYAGKGNPDWHMFVTSIKKVIIEEGATTIGDYAFQDKATTLTQVTIPDSVTSIGDYAFSYCGVLESVNFGENSQLRTIGVNAFAGCSALTDFEIPDSVETIGQCAFQGCSALTGITFPDSLTTIVYGTFAECTSLAEINLPETVTSIGNYAFADCTSLGEIIIPVATENIGAFAFVNCSALTGITILNPDCEIYDSADTIPQTTIIRGYLASGAQAYAEKYDRIFEPIDSHILMGDIDNDGNITAGDARLALRASVGLEMLTTRQKHIGDVDKDNIITAGDARLILRWSVGMLEDR